ncbi:MAG: DUF3316 domain-containing protein [Tannerella sp.]|jgi:hypothetical protein|nr:DUF3316 domain-containing protein [Tannerella sp.]
MKTMTKHNPLRNNCFLLLFLCVFSHLTTAQTDSSLPFSINESTLIGIGGYHIKNTYLAPVNYSGTGIRIVNERMKIVSLADRRVSSQQILDIDLSSVSNPAGSVGALAGFANYSFGYHYRFQPAQNFKLLTGAALKGMFGFVYNTQSANNPIATHIDIDLNASIMAIYTLKIKNYPLTFRIQTDIPLSGVLFTPARGQSYYEIFDLGNTSGIVGFSSLHNKFAMRNHVSIDFSIWKYTLRIAYLNGFYRTGIKGIRTRYVSHNLMIGLVKEFILFSGKNLKKENGYQSAYY